LSTHQCLRPQGATEPWRCPDCGLLWEPLPSAPVEAPKRRISISHDTVIVVSCVAGGVLCVGALAVSLEAAIVAMAAVGLVALVYAFRLISRL